jgi:hypothetical protein
LNFSSTTVYFYYYCDASWTSYRSGSLPSPFASQSLSACVLCYLSWHFKHIYMSFVCLVLLWCCWYNTSLMRICWYVYLFSLFLFFLIISTTYDLMLSVLLLSASETFNFSPVKDVSAKLAFWLNYIAIVSSSFAF